MKRADPRPIIFFVKAKIAPILLSFGLVIAFLPNKKALATKAAASTPGGSFIAEKTTSLVEGAYYMMGYYWNAQNKLQFLSVPDPLDTSAPTEAIVTSLDCGTSATSYPVRKNVVAADATGAIFQVSNIAGDSADFQFLDNISYLSSSVALQTSFSSTIGALSFTLALNGDGFSEITLSSNGNALSATVNSDNSLGSFTFASTSGNICKSFLLYSIDEDFVNTYTALSVANKASVASSHGDTFSTIQAAYQNLAAKSRRLFAESTNATFKASCTAYQALDPNVTWPFLAAEPTPLIDYPNNRLTGLIYGNQYVFRYYPGTYSSSGVISAGSSSEFCEVQVSASVDGYLPLEDQGYDFCGANIDFGVDDQVRVNDYDSPTITLQILPRPAAPTAVLALATFDLPDQTSLSKLFATNFTLSSLGEGYLYCCVAAGTNYSGFLSSWTNTLEFSATSDGTPLSPGSAYVVYATLCQGSDTPSKPLQLAVTTLSQLEGLRRNVIFNNVTLYRSASASSELRTQLYNQIQQLASSATTLSELTSLEESLENRYSLLSLQETLVATFVNDMGGMLSNDSAASAALYTQFYDALMAFDYTQYSSNLNATFSTLLSNFEAALSLNRHREANGRTFVDFFNTLLSQHSELDATVVNALWSSFDEGFKAILAAPSAAEADSLLTSAEKQLTTMTEGKM